MIFIHWPQKPEPEKRRGDYARWEREFRGVGQFAMMVAKDTGAPVAIGDPGGVKPVVGIAFP